MVDAPITSEITDPRIRLSELAPREQWWARHGGWLVAFAAALVAGGISWGMLSAQQEATASKVEEHRVKIEDLQKTQAKLGQDIQWMRSAMERWEQWGYPSNKPAGRRRRAAP